MSAYKFTPCAVASPDAPQKPLVRKRARSGRADWVKTARETTPSKAKRPRTAGSQQPACTHKEHQILATAEAASFASQFWDGKAHPTKASQHEFLATCIDVVLENNVKHAQGHKYMRKRGHQTTYFVPSRVSSSFQLFAQNYGHPPHPPTPYISEMAFSHRFQKVYISPPPKGTIFRRIG